MNENSGNHTEQKSLTRVHIWELEKHIEEIYYKQHYVEK